MSEVVNFSSKMDADVREKLNSMAEQSGLTLKDFMGRLVVSYETAQERESMGQVKELENLRHHLARVEEIYISIVKAAQDRQEADASRISDAEAEAQAAKAEAHEREKMAADAIDSANERAQRTESEAALIREQTNKELNEMKDALAREKEAREQSARHANLAEQAAYSAKEKAEALEGQAQKAEQFRQERDALQEDNKALGSKVDQLQCLLEQTQMEAQKKLDAQAEQVKEKIERLNEQHNEAISRALEKAEVEKDKAVLIAQREFMKEIAGLRESLAQCREEKAQLEAQVTVMSQTINLMEDQNETRT